MNEQSKQKAEGDRWKILTWWENIKKNCLSQNGNSLLGFLRRLHFSELEKKKGSHSLAARSDGNQPSCRLGLAELLGLWLPHTGCVVRKQPRKLMEERCLTLRDSRKGFWGPTWCDFSSSGRQYSPQKNFRIQHCLKTKVWNWPQTNAWDLGRKSKNSMGHDILPACFPEKPLA